MSGQALPATSRHSTPAHVSTDPFQRRTVLALESINRILTREAEERGETTRKQNLVDEWKFVSRVLDRTLFITFTTAAIIFNLTILTSSPFRERFSYCPIDDCEDLTMEEIMDLTANSASKHHFSGAAPTGVTEEESPAAAHLQGGPDDIVALPEEHGLGPEGLKPSQKHQRPPPLQRGWREPAEPWDENVYTATPGPEYLGYERQLPTLPQAQPSPRGTSTRDGGRRG